MSSSAPLDNIREYHTIVTVFCAAILLCAGPIPKVLGALSKLKEVSLQDNQLTGVYSRRDE